MQIIAESILALQHTYPQIKYHLQSGYAYDVIEQLDKGLLDFGVLIEPIDLTQYDHIRLPITNTLGLLMRKDHPLAYSHRSNQRISAIFRSFVLNRYYQKMDFPAGLVMTAANLILQLHLI